MKVLVTGVKGQLGYDVVKALTQDHVTCRGVDKDDFDLTDKAQVMSYIGDYAPDIVVHCAAYTAVDLAEDERELCYAVNVLGTRHVAEACKELQARMVYISTDYVFDGKGDKPYEVYHQPDPINHYGRTKYEGELEVKRMLHKYYIIRVSWVFGINGNNFIKTMMRLGQSCRELSVVADQIGAPTYTADLARLIGEMIETDKYGIYHVTNEGCCSWYEFACEIFRSSGMDVEVQPIQTEAYPTKARRPRNSRLSKASLDEAHFRRLPPWEDAVSRFLMEYRQVLQVSRT